MHCKFGGVAIITMAKDDVIYFWITSTSRGDEKIHRPGNTLLIETTNTHTQAQAFRIISPNILLSPVAVYWDTHYSPVYLHDGK